MERQGDRVIHGKLTHIDVVRKFATDRGGYLLSTVYVNALSALEWKCSEGHLFSTTFNHIKNRKQWCPVCGRSKAAKTIREMFKSDLSIRERISTSHLKRLKKKGFYTGKTQRQIASNIRDNLTGLFRNPSKHLRILKYVGCSLDELKAYLESKFAPGMTWENRGSSWHIDHVKPLASFDLTIESEIYASSNYTNLQPLWAKDNLTKGSKYE